MFPDKIIFLLSPEKAVLKYIPHHHHHNHKDRKMYLLLKEESSSFPFICFGARRGQGTPGAVIL